MPLVPAFGYVNDRRQGVATFIETYNDEWLIECVWGHRTPRQVFMDATAAEAA
jgi:hypothetical protein